MSAKDAFHDVVRTALLLDSLLTYRTALTAKDPARILYLAVPLEVDTNFLTIQFTQIIIQNYQLKLIVYDVDNKEIVRWQG